LLIIVKRRNKFDLLSVTSFHALLAHLHIVGSWTFI